MSVPERQLKVVTPAALLDLHCPVDSLMRAAMPDYEVSWERLV